MVNKMVDAIRLVFVPPDMRYLIHADSDVEEESMHANEKDIN